MSSNEEERERTDDKNGCKDIKDRRKRKKRGKKRTNEGHIMVEITSNENNMVEVIDVEQFKDKAIVDLTSDTSRDIYVDLTKESPKRTTHSDNSLSVISIRSPDDETLPSSSKASTHQKTVDDSITCAICMSSLTQIKNDKCQLMSTTCGHVFCNMCISSALSSQAKCPTCRKKVTKKQLHPIYI